MITHTKCFIETEKKETEKIGVSLIWQATNLHIITLVFLYIWCKLDGEEESEKASVREEKQSLNERDSLSMNLLH